MYKNTLTSTYVYIPKKRRTDTEMYTLIIPA